MKKVLITGANGFIGKHCIPLLLEKGYEVHGVSTRNNESNLIHWHKADLLGSLHPACQIDQGDLDHDDQAEQN